MAFTRKFLSALGIEDDKIDEIITAHTDVTNALKEERDKYKGDAEKYKADAEKLEGVQKELDSVKADENPYEQKLNDLQAEFDQYKADVEAKALTARKAEAYKQLLKDAGVAEKRIDTVVKASPDKIAELEFLEDGKVKDAESLTGELKKEWSDFIVTTEKKGSNPATPPSSTGGSMTKEQIMAIKNPQERHKAIAENIEIFDHAANNEGE